LEIKQKDDMKNLTKYILIVTITNAALIYAVTLLTIKSEELKYIRLSQIYSLTSLALLYLTLIMSPLFVTFPNLPYRPYLVKARKGLGLSAFFFGLLHAITSFFKLLGGFAGLAFLNHDYIFAILLSTGALTILSIMALTSLHWCIQKLGKCWKTLHRLVYIAGLLILIHALMLGTHFANLSTAIPQICLTALVLLGLLETVRIDTYISAKIPRIPRFVPAITIATALVMVIIQYGTPYLNGSKTANIHKSHDSQNAQQPNTGPNMNHISNEEVFFPSRFIVKESDNNQIPINTQFTKQFNIFDQKSQQNVSLFRTIYEKQMHTVITDSTLTYFQHTHPTQNGTTFTLNTTVNQPGIYFVYLDYEPIGATEQQSLFKLYTAADNQVFPLSRQPVDQNFTKTTASYQVTLNNPDTLDALALKAGTQSLSFTVTDAATKQPITTLQPYLGAFGHLSMINQYDYSFIHVHPKMVAQTPDQTTGPTIEFNPMPTTNNLIPGNYRVFTEFKHNNAVFVVDFTIKVQ
jgi:DMSO/TMAO reductase YedYZ heme-binding membrane subunit